MPELNLILLGPPGSGKGTQGERLQEDFRLPYYATGDILRAAVADGTDIGLAAKEYMDRGDLVPDDVIIGVIEERVQGEEAADGFILDGFPRTVGQAEALGEAMDGLGRGITAAVLIEVADEEVIRRLGGRRTCAIEAWCASCGTRPPLGAPPWRFQSPWAALLEPARRRPIQRATRGRVVVPGGRHPGLPSRRLRAAAAGRHSPLRFKDRLEKRPSPERG